MEKKRENGEKIAQIPGKAPLKSSGDPEKQGAIPERSVQHNYGQMTAMYNLMNTKNILSTEKAELFCKPVRKILFSGYLQENLSIFGQNVLIICDSVN